MGQERVEGLRRGRERGRDGDKRGRGRGPGEGVMVSGRDGRRVGWEEGVLGVHSGGERGRKVFGRWLLRL